jgi:hypothetical protein
MNYALTLETAACRATASKAALLLSGCVWWARHEAEWVYTTSPAADKGTRFHAAIAHYIDSGEVPPMADDIEALFKSARAWVDGFGRDKLSAEVALAWDHAADTARRVDAPSRGYPKAPGCLYGTADVVAVNRALRVGYLVDWKSGDGSGATPQLRTLAMMLARSEGLDSVTVEALEVSAVGVTAVCRETLDSLALDAHAGELADAIAAIPTAEPTPGPHCGELYCACRATCPAGRTIVEQVIPAEALVKHRWSVDIASPEHAAWLLDHARLVEAAAKAVKDAVKAACPPEGWTLADGSTLREGTRDMPRFDRDRAVALLRECGATEEQIAALTYRVQESAGLRLHKPASEKPRRQRKAAA